MNWSMLPLQAIMNVRVGAHVRGSVGGFPTFPSWLGKNSARNKRKRLLAELTLHLNNTVSAGQRDIRMQYLTHLRDTLLRPLLRGASSAVGDPSATILMMDAYGLSRDDVFDTMAEFGLKGSSDPFLKIGSKVSSSSE